MEIQLFLILLMCIAYQSIVTTQLLMPCNQNSKHKVVPHNVLIQQTRNITMEIPIRHHQESKFEELPLEAPQLYSYHQDKSFVYLSL